MTMCFKSFLCLPISLSLSLLRDRNTPSSLSPPLFLRLFPVVRSFIRPFALQVGLDGEDARLIEDRGGGRSTMHVQSISHWAPANIGPYSQAVKVM